MPTYAEVRTWDPAPLGLSGDRLQKSITTLERSRDEIETTAVPPSWTGLAAVAAVAQQAYLVRSMETKIERARRLARGLFDAEASIVSLRRLVEDTEGQAASEQFQIGPDGSVRSTMKPPTFESTWEAVEWSASRQAKAVAIADDLTRIMERAVAIDTALLAAIPYRDPESELRGVADPAVAHEWAQLSMEERQAILRQIVEEELADLDLDPPPTVTFVDPDDPNADQFYANNDANGWWSEGRNEIWINPNALDDPRRLHTAAHEARHARQASAVDDLDRSLWDRLRGHDPFERHEEAGVTRRQAEEWRDAQYFGVGDPKPGGGTYTYEDYTRQPVEADAFGRGRDYLNGLTAAELERLRRDSR